VISHVQSTTNPPPADARRFKLDPEHIRNQATIQRTTGRPAAYSWWNNTVILTRIPDTASVGQLLEFRGYAQPAVLTGVQATVLRDEWDLPIVIGAQFYLWTMFNESDRAYESKQTFGALVNEIADPRRLHADEWGWQTGTASPPYMRSS
jgi:hypothetical protein